MIDLAHAMELALSKNMVASEEEFIKNQNEARDIVKNLTDKYVC